MTKDSNSVDRAKVATSAGLVTGVLKGKKEALKILSPYKLALTAGEIGSDTYIKNKSEYVRSCVDKNIENVSNTLVKTGDRIKAFQEISVNAAKEFENTVRFGIKKIMKQAGTTRLKYLAIYGAIGVTLDVTVNKIAAKIKENYNKKEQF